MKKAIVIGATSGIGEELAKLLADNGYKVGITGRRTELLEKLQGVNSNFHIKTLDVTETTITVEKLEELVSEMNGLDLLILSSGTGELRLMRNSPWMPLPWLTKYQAATIHNWKKSITYAP
jgi:NADP-dependent 3-hydroxy acid dehydrogenase YdfG